jgi:hypothetical protein
MELVTIKSSIIIEVKWHGRCRDCGLLIHRRSTNGGVDGAVKGCLRDIGASLKAFDVALQVKTVHLFILLSAL